MKYTKHAIKVSEKFASGAKESATLPPFPVSMTKEHFSAVTVHPKDIGTGLGGVTERSVVKKIAL